VTATSAGMHTWTIRHPDHHADTVEAYAAETEGGIVLFKDRDGETVAIVHAAPGTTVTRQPASPRHALPEGFQPTSQLVTNIDLTPGCAATGAHVQTWPGTFNAGAEACE
jgi:hypothetical protein